MKKILLTILIIFGSIPVFSQTKIGIKVSPALSTNRVIDNSDSLNFAENGLGGKLPGGLMVDFFFSENYYFGSGIFYTPKRVGIKTLSTNDPLDEVYKLQYLQIPLTVKLFTNELTLDTRMYFQAGALWDIKIHESPLEREGMYIKSFNRFDVSALVSAGIEYRVGYDTMIFGGFSYQRGLTNVIKEKVALDGPLFVKNDMVSLDFGIKF